MPRPAPPPIPLPTAEELKKQLADLPSPPPGMVHNVFPPAREHYWDPFWWNTGGQDIIEQRHVFDRYSGEDQVKQLRAVFGEFPNHKQRVLQKAAGDGFPDAVRTILSMGIPAGGKEERARKRDDDGEIVDGEFEDEDMDADPFTPMHEAALNGHLECVKILVEEGDCDVNELDDRGAKALIYAIRGHHTDIAKYLLAQGTDPVTKGAGLNVLEHSVLAGDVETLKLFLGDERLEAAGYQLDISNIRNAVGSKNRAMLNFHLEHFGFPQKTEDGSFLGDKLTSEQKDTIEGALDAAILRNDTQTTRLLLSYLTPPHPDDPSRFQFYKMSARDNIIAVFNESEDVAEKDNIELFELIGDTLMGPPPPHLAPGNFISEPGLNFDWIHRRLISASATGALRVIKYLVEKLNANIDYISHKYYQTPVFGAASQSKEKTLEYLLERGADLHIGIGRYANGPTALHNAIRNRNSGTAKILLKYGGPVEEINPDIEKVFEEGKLVAVSIDKFRAPVYVMSPTQFKEFEKEIESRDEVFQTITVSVDESCRSWIQDLQVRKRDEVLKGQGELDRAMMKEEDEAEKGKLRKADNDGWRREVGFLPY